MEAHSKSLLYTRDKEEEPTPQRDNLEGTSFQGGPQPASGESHEFHPQIDPESDDEEEEEEEDSSSEEEEIDENTDIFSYEFVRSRVVNMPELIELIKDPEVLEHLKNPQVTEYLRDISLDPNNKIPEHCDKPEIAFLKKKMEDLVKRFYPDAQVPVHFEKPSKK